jgi:ribonuclease Z
MSRSVDTPVVIETARFTIEGKSRAGNETYFHVPELGVSLDIGRCPDLLIGVPHIFVTHSHLDHALGIPFYAAQRRLRQLPPGTIYIPAETLEDYRALMRLHEKLEATEYPLNLVGLAPADRISLRRDLEVVAHRSTHRVPTVGYEFVEVRHKLMAAYQGFDGPTLARLRQQGEEPSEAVRKSLLFYTGDTDRRVLEQGEAIFKSEVLLIECSFTVEGEEPRGARYQHMHLSDLYEFADRFENEVIVLTHFSLRDSPSEIHRTISRSCPAVLRERLRFALPAPFTQL